MLLVRGLSLRTGMARDHRGRLVWADIAWDDSGVAGPDPYEVAIRDDWAGLARRYAGVPSLGSVAPLCKGEHYPGAGGLITAPTAWELAALLRRLQCDRLLPLPDVVHGSATADALASQLS